MGCFKMIMMFVFLLILERCLSSEGCLQHERSALLQLKHNFINSPYRLRDWVDDENYSDCCQWEGVECNNTSGRVIGLYLNGVRYYDGDFVAGYLNASLFTSFQQLESLDLSSNNIIGCVKNEGLESLSRLSNLKFLDLSGNYFNNSILSSLAGLSSLRNLSLALNRLKGSIELRELDSLSNLEMLDMWGNEIDNLVVPKDLESLSKLSNLKLLDLSFNNFNNSILSSLAGLSSLKSLSLASNRLEGSIEVRELDSLINLEELDISSNEIDKFVGSKGVSKLRHLDLSSNKLNCSILSTLTALSSLRFLNLADIGFKGSFDVQELDSLSNLEILDMSWNEIDNLVVPKDYRGLRKLNWLSLSNNNIKDGSEILQSMGSFPSLKTLSLRRNNFTRTVTTTQELRNFTNLEDLSLDGSSLHISLLQSIAAFTSLKTLSMSECQLNGVLPRDQGFLNFENLEYLAMDSAYVALNSNVLQIISESMTSLKFLSLSFSELNGSILDQGLCKLVHLQGLHINNNGLRGTLPRCLGNMTSLQALDVSFNQLNGTIVDEGSINYFSGICELLHLEELHIDNNDLRGGLPWCLSNMTSLQILDVSSNQLNGDIPSSLCELVHVQELHIDNNYLTGGLPWCLSNMTSLLVLDASFNQLTGNISSSLLMYLTSIIELTLSNNHLRIPISLEPFFNLSKLKKFDGENNQIYVENESHSSLTPKFQLTSFSLSGYGAGGTFPKFLYHQHDLEHVDLSHVNLTGEFPNWLLENNTNLNILLLANNSLSGSLRMPIHSHRQLIELDVSNNFFQGLIPKEIRAYLPSLMQLNLSKNAFNGSIPSSFGDMNSLESLDISYNQLTGEIPEHLTMVCSSLGILALSNNSLQGRLFSKNFNLRGLWMLQLDGNQFIGEIPESLSISSHLIGLHLGDNHLSGKIPKWLGNMSRLEEIMMPNNHFAGSIPIEFCQLNVLKILDLSNNSISGSLPSCFSPFSIEQVHLSRNKIEGHLKDVFNDSPFLATLDLSYNQFHGSIPNWIDRLSQLSYLLLANNHLKGEMPVQLCRLKHLRLIDLSHNNISGHILHCLINTALGLGEGHAPASASNFSSNFSSMRKEETVQFTTKKMSYYYQGRVLTSMFGIDLSYNKLTGEIPIEIGYLTRIRALNLSHNNLTGAIPMTFSNLKQIESLDLSFNLLNGKIPSQLTELTTLAVFSVAYNNLSGKIPDLAQFSTFEKNSYEGNHFLCGLPLPKCNENGSSLAATPKASTGIEEDDCLIDMKSFFVTFTASYVIVILGIVGVLWVNPYWRRKWFYLVEMWMTSCYYFILDNFMPTRFCSGHM